MQSHQTPSHPRDASSDRSMMFLSAAGATVTAAWMILIYVDTPPGVFQAAGANLLTSLVTLVRSHQVLGTVAGCFAGFFFASQYDDAEETPHQTVSKKIN